MIYLISIPWVQIAYNVCLGRELNSRHVDFPFIFLEFLQGSDYIIFALFS